MTDDERVADAGARPINGHELLERLAALPVATWRYHWEPPDVRHLGPMSQDFRAAFDLGSDEHEIGPGTDQARAGRLSAMSVSDRRTFSAATRLPFCS